MRRSTFKISLLVSCFVFCLVAVYLFLLNQNSKVTQLSLMEKVPELSRAPRISVPNLHKEKQRAPSSSVDTHYAHQFMASAIDAAIVENFEMRMIAESLDVKHYELSYLGIPVNGSHITFVDGVPRSGLLPEGLNDLAAQMDAGVFGEAWSHARLKQEFGDAATKLDIISASRSWHYDHPNQKWRALWRYSVDWRDDAGALKREVVDVDAKSGEKLRVNKRVRNW